MVEQTLRGGIGASVEVELEVKRSRFICRLERVDTEELAREVIDRTRKERWNAGHHCSAFVLGSSSMPDQVRRSNDDGEPSGTAGRPMLDALIGRGLMDCVAVVSRYFGGTLLGTGGLIRAYSDAVVSAAEEAATANALVLREHRLLFTLDLAHADAGRVEAELRHRGIAVVGTEYGRAAVMTIATRVEDEAALHVAVASVTSGARILQPVGTQWVDVELKSR